MTEMDLHHHTRLARIAHLYYEEQLTQNEIAERMGLSRVKIHRLLKEARERAVVRIAVDWPLPRQTVLESSVCAKFGLGKAIVIDESDVPELSEVERVAIASAQFLGTVLRSDQTMAVCLGRTTNAVIDAMEPSKVTGLRVAQAIGSVPLPNRDFDSATLVRRLAEKLGGDVTFLRAPPVADTPEAAATIADQRDVSWSLDAARSADVALVGIGTVTDRASVMLESGAINKAELADARQRGAVGDVAWRLVSASGELVECALNERVIGVSIADLREIPVTVAAAVGGAKASAIAGVLRSGAVDVLCTDAATASRILRVD